MASGDRNKAGKPTDIVRHYSKDWNGSYEGSKALCGNKQAGYLTGDINDTTCITCLNKLSKELENKTKIC